MFSGFKRRRSVASAAISACLLLAGVLPAPALAQDRDPERRHNNSRVTVEVGQPNIWSLAQAHYLLSVMRHSNRDLRVNVPDPSKLDPNTINGNRLELLRQMFGLEAQFNSVTGTQNRVALDKFNSDFTRRDAVRARLDQRRDVLFALIGDISLLNSQLAQEQGQGPFADAREAERQARVRDLQNAIAGRNAQKAAVEAELAALNTEATSLNTAVGTPPTLSSPLPAASPAPLPDFSAAMGALLNKTANNFSTPSLDSSIVLDNHVQMQYEIIAKQLTLMRDELGPDERLIFLELPTSIYTVPTKDNDYVVQVELEVKNYIAARQPTPTPTPAPPASGILTETPAPSPTPAPDADENKPPVMLRQLLRLEPGPQQESDERKRLREKRLRWRSLSRDEREGLEREEKEACRKDDGVLLKDPDDRRLADLRQRYGDEKTEFRRVSLCGPSDPLFRIIDLIPRQSDLNVNDAVGSVRNWNFAGALNFLFGFGARIGFQRQREQFEQFIQQDVFASAYGKGLSRFGWTFGPHPGTTRLNPGLRTTYAVMVVPRDALAVELAAKGKVFHRKRSPDYDDDEDNVNTFPRAGSESFTLLIPQEATERFYVKGIDYTPASKGGRVTAVLSGEHFSPQIGVFVNGTPLKRAVSITKQESEATSGVNMTPGVQGEFEFLSSESLVLNFSMGDPNYTGTPLITLVTPEKTSSINFFQLELNHGPRVRLIDEGERHPMFLEPFDLTTMDRPVAVAGRPELVSAEINGNGFVPKAKFWVNGHQIVCREYRGGMTYCEGMTNGGPVMLSQPLLVSSRRYRIEFPREWIQGEAESKVRMTQHGTHGIQEKTIVFNQTIPGEFEVVDVRPGRQRAAPEVDVRLRLPAGQVASSVRVEAGSAAPQFGYLDEGNNTFLLTFTAPQDTLQLSVPTAAGGRRTLRIAVPFAPSVTGIRNPDTGRPSAPAETDGLQAVIEGRHFTHVRRVLFGTQPAEIVSIDPSGRTMYVNLPRGAAGKVNVLLETDVTFRGRKVSNVGDFGALGRAHFTFVKPPARPAEL